MPCATVGYTLDHVESCLRKKGRSFAGGWCLWLGDAVFVVAGLLLSGGGPSGVGGAGRDLAEKPLRLQAKGSTGGRLLQPPTVSRRPPLNSCDLAVAVDLQNIVEAARR